MSLRLGKTLLLLPFLPLGWFCYGAWLKESMPKVEIRELTPLATSNEHTLPFFELMSPVPELGNAEALPKLEYKKGPPDRYLERISVLFQMNAQAPKERITYFGRHTRNNIHGLSLLPDDSAREAHFVELAIRASQGLDTLSGFWRLVYRPLLLQEAARHLEGYSSVAIMDQAGSPAFFFEAPASENGRAKASMLFIRHNSFYRVDFVGDRGFSILNPEQLFRKSFLTERRLDALAYITHNLSEVKLEAPEAKTLKLSEVAWPILLLAAHVSIDPSSIDTYFHFAGLNALLYRNTASSDASQDLELTDTLRNNVLSSDLYAHDVAPETDKTAQINRLARLLTRNIEQ